MEKHRNKEFAERRVKKKKMLDEEEEDMKKEKDERKKKELEMATTPAPGAVADEMDVVVSENAAVHTAVNSVASSGLGSISDTTQRLAEDLAQAISSRVTGLPVSTVTSGPALTSTAPSKADQQLLLSSLQDLLPGPGQPGVPPTSLSTVPQSLSSTYATGASASGPGLSQASTGRPSVDITTSSSSESVTSPSDLPPRGPTFQFTTRPPERNTGSTGTDKKTPTFSRSFPATEISDPDSSESDENDEDIWQKKQQITSAKVKVRFELEECTIKDMNESGKIEKETEQNTTKYWIDYHDSPSPPFPPGFLSDEAWSPENKKKEDEKRSYRLRKKVNLLGTLYKRKRDDDEGEDADDSDNEDEDDDDSDDEGEDDSNSDNE